MCGICGFTGDPSPDRLSAMMDRLVHRGPDGEGRHESARVSLGHRRLAIIDLESGQQPLANEDGSVLAVVNGEIYNHRALRRELEAAGHRFRTRSDSEVLPHLYEAWGPDFVSRLDGMFAFAVWDEVRGRLLLGRDRLGIKPLYYRLAEGRLQFASEAKALLPLMPGRPRLCRDAFERFLVHRYVPDPDCLFEGIQKLRPGHTLQWADGEAADVCYWSPLPFLEAEALSESAAVEQLEERLRRAVDERLMSDVALGAYLSGGLDSSLIVALMAELSRDPVRTFSVAFPGAGRYDESAQARAVAGRFATEHRELAAGVHDLDLLREVVWHLDEPMGDAATLPTWRMAEATKPHATVVLTGEGADELFAGYAKYPVLLALERTRSVARHPARALASLFRDTRMRRGLAYAGSATADRWRRYAGFLSVFDVDDDHETLLADGRGHADILDREAERLRQRMAGAPDAEPLNGFLALDLLTWLPGDLLAKVDRMTMAHAVEARVPYLDHQLVEFALGLPACLKRRGLRNKVLLRRLAATRLPAATANRAKQGFTVPLRKWLEEGLGDYAEDLFAESRFRQQGLFNPRWYRNLFRRRPDTAYNRRQFWSMLFFQIWMDVYEVQVP